MKNSLKVRFSLVFGLVFLSTGLKAQDSLSLRDCINYAWEHNIALQKNYYNNMQQGNSYKRSLASAFPSVNGFAGQNNNFGRTVDPFSNQFVNQQVRSASFSLNSDVVLFQGLQKMNEIRQMKWAETAGEYSYQKAKDDVALTVANFYLQILLTRERLKQVEGQLSNDTSILSRTEILYNAGSVARARLSEVRAQVASDEALLVDVRNQLLQSQLSLKQFMNYDITAPLNIKFVRFSPGFIKTYSRADLSTAMGTRIEELPAIKAVVSNYMSAKYNLKSAQGFLWPRISASASLNSVYSNLAQQYGYIQSGYQPIGFVATDSVQVLAPKYVTTSQPISFSDQLNNNFGQSLSFGVSIPIFNGLQSHTNAQNAKINLSIAELNEQDARNQAKNDVYQAFETMNMAFQKMKAAQTKQDAQQELLNQAEVQFSNGLMSYFDFYTARTAFNAAQSELLSAKYEYVFQKQVFEYYLGQPIQFENE